MDPVRKGCDPTLRARRAGGSAIEVSESRPSRAGGAQCPKCGDRYDLAARYCQRDGAPLLRGDAGPDPYLGRELLGQFRLEEVIGAGGMGTVYRARQASLDRDVAIKILHPEMAANADAVRRFQREARIATALDHPNVVRVLLLGQLEDGALYLVMEHLSGRSLGELLRQEARMSLDRALHLALQICDGVGEAHAHGVVHRDVKPENVMVVRRGADEDFVKVLDFGIARLLWDEQTVATQSGVIFGTARYISPEGASGEATDARSDVYSIGVVLYQLLAGETPFDGATPVTLLLKHVNETAPDIRDRVRVPDPIADVLMKALRKRPGDRHADAGAFADALREAALVSGVGAQSPVGASVAPVSSSHAPAPAAPTFSAGGAVGGPAPGAASGRFGDTLARAPSPFTEEPTDVGGRRAPRTGPGLGLVATVTLAFFLGAFAVTLGAVLVAWLVRPQVADTPAAVTEAPAAPAAPSAEPREPAAGDTTAPAAPDAPVPTEDVRAATASAREGAEAAPPSKPAAPDPAPRARRRPRRGPVTTIRPGRGTPPAVLAPAVQDEPDDATAMEPPESPPPAVEPPSPEPPATEPPVSEPPATEPPAEVEPPPVDELPPNVEPPDEQPPPPWTDGTLL